MVPLSMESCIGDGGRKGQYSSFVGLISSHAERIKPTASSSAVDVRWSKGLVLGIESGAFRTGFQNILS